MSIPPPRPDAAALAAALRVAPLSTLNGESCACLAALARGGLADDGDGRCGVDEPTPLPLTADLLAARHGAPSAAAAAPLLASALAGPPVPPPPPGGARARAALVRSLERAAATTYAHAAAAAAAGPATATQPCQPSARRPPVAVRWRDQRPLDVGARDADAALAAVFDGGDCANDAPTPATARRDGGRAFVKLVIDAWRAGDRGGGGGGALALALRPLRAAAAAADGGRGRAFDAVLALALHADLVDGPAGADDGTGSRRQLPPPPAAFLDWATHLLAVLLDDAAAAADVPDADWRAAADALAAVAARRGALTARAAAAIPPRAALALAAAAADGGWPPHVAVHAARLAVASVYGNDGGGGCPVDAQASIDAARLAAAGGLPAFVGLLRAFGGAAPPETRRNVACVLIDGLAAGAAGEAGQVAARALVSSRPPAGAADALAAALACDDGADDDVAAVVAALGAGLPAELAPAAAALSCPDAARRGNKTLPPPACAAVDLLTSDDARAGDAGWALLAAALARAPADTLAVLPEPSSACSISAVLTAALGSSNPATAPRVVAAVRGALLAWARKHEAPPLATALTTFSHLAAWLATAPLNCRPRATADAVDMLLDCVARPHPVPATLAGGGGAADGLAALAAVLPPTPAFLAGVTALPDAVAAVLPVDGLKSVLSTAAAAPRSSNGHAARAADARLACLLLLLAAGRAPGNDAAATLDNPAALLAAAGDDPRARSAAAAAALTKLDATRGADLAAALAAAAHDAAARGEAGPAAAPVPLLEAAVGTGRVRVD